MLLYSFWCANKLQYMYMYILHVQYSVLIAKRSISIIKFECTIKVTLIKTGLNVHCLQKQEKPNLDKLELFPLATHIPGFIEKLW